jgi:PAS domain S-box-containing protein
MPLPRRRNRSTESPSDPRQALRGRAETIARERASQAPEKLESLAAEGFERTLHELRVHQIELEIQNEELRRTQEEVEASRVRYFDLYDLAPVGYFTVNQQGLIVDANLTAAKLLGVARGDIVNQPLSRFVLPEDQDTNYLHVKQLFKAGGPLQWEMRLVRKAAAPFWSCVEATRVYDADGASICRAVVSDITERVRARQELLDAHSRSTAAYEELAAIYAHAPIIMLVVDEELRVIKVNDMAIRFAGGEGSSSGGPVSRVALDTITHGTRQDQVEVWLTEQRCLLISTAPMQFEGRKTALVCAQDVTELKQTVRQLESALAEKTVLLKEVHHRVKNNLAVISGLLRMQADTHGSAEVKDAFAQSQMRVHAMALIHEHLYGNDHLDRVDFSEYARQLVGEMYAAFVGEPGRISLEIAADPIELGLDRAVPCALILNELLSNAFKHAFPGERKGEIRISFREQAPGQLELAIQDDGIGSASQGEHKAKSLGLSIVGILTTQLDGTLQQEPCAGTRFVLRFPAAGRRLV